MTVIYADTVFVMNWLLDYLLLLSTAKLAAAPFRRLRLMAAAALGGIYAVAVFLPRLWFLSHPVCHLLCALLMILTAFGAGRGWVRLFAVLLAVSGALAGMLVALSLLRASSGSFPGSIPVSAADGKSLLLAGAVCYWISSLLMGRLIPERGTELLPVRLFWQGRSAELTVLPDSGNLLTDADGCSVLVADLQAVKSLLPDKPELTAQALLSPVDCMSRIGSAWGTGRLSLLSYHSVGKQQGLLLSIRTDYAIIGSKVVPGQSVAIVPEPVSAARYQGIIGTSYFSREDTYETHIFTRHPHRAAPAKGRASAGK